MRRQTFGKNCLWRHKFANTCLQTYFCCENLSPDVGFCKQNRRGGVCKICIQKQMFANNNLQKQVFAKLYLWTLFFTKQISDAYFYEKATSEAGLCISQKIRSKIWSYHGHVFRSENENLNRIMLWRSKKWWYEQPRGSFAHRRSGPQLQMAIDVTQVV